MSWRKEKGRLFSRVEVERCRVFSWRKEKGIATIVHLHLGPSPKTQYDYDYNYGGRNKLRPSRSATLGLKNC